MAPDDDEALAKECFEAIRAGEFKTVIDQLDPQLQTTGVESNLTQVASILDHGEPLSLELVGCNVFSNPDKKRSFLTYQYQFTNAWVIAAITIDTIGGVKRVLSVNVNPIPKSLGELNAFTLSGKGILHYVLLVLAIIVPIFIIWTLVLCIRTKIRKKWLWLIFIILGIFQIKLNWTTGQMGIQPLAVQLFGAGFSKMGLFAPWILSVAIPIGAIVFLIKRKKLRVIDDLNSNTEHAPPEERGVPPRP